VRYLTRVDAEHCSSNRTLYLMDSRVWCGWDWVHGVSG
jgi:hypothetical protein